MNNCKKCKYYDIEGYCTLINIDDERYTHNNHKLVGLQVYVCDDQGLDVLLRVSPDFGCVCFKEKTNV